jgi:outer membrane protein assembly factor BamA
MSPRPHLRRALALSVVTAALLAPAGARADAPAPAAAAATRRTIARIQLSGEALDRATTLDAAGLAEGGPVPGDLARSAARIQALYESRGFPSARVEIEEGDTDDPSRVVVSIAVYHQGRGGRALGPGPALTIASRVFVIEPARAAEAGALLGRYRVNEGARADHTALVEADRELAALLRQEGFFGATVRGALSTERGATRLRVFVDPGPRLVASFEDNRAFDDDQLREALALRDAREARPQDLALRLRAFYVEHGFLDAEVKVELRGDPKERVQPLVFTVHEHDQVRVARRVFPCLTGGPTADEIGAEIRSFLEEDLPGAEPLWSGDPATLARLFGPTAGVGARPAPLPLHPAVTYAPETYDRALDHLRDLFRSRGYLNAVVGPLRVVRARCQRGSPAGVCLPEPLPEAPPLTCPKDAWGLPAPVPDVPAELTCEPDPRHGVACAPEITLRIPIHLGPPTELYDIAFDGNASFPESYLAGLLDLEIGAPLSTVALEAARSKLVEEYRNAGYAFVEARSAIEPSPDRTRARVRFVVEEGPLVRIRDVVLRGATRTDPDLVLGRMALRRGTAYRQDLARVSEERIATLGTFSSVTIGLERPDVPEADKRVVVTVVEQLPQYLEPKIGFSTGDGLRFGLDYGHRNVAGRAIAFSLSTQLNYLFDFMIIDPAVRKNYDAGDCRRDASDRVVCQPLQVVDRLEQRTTASITFPEIGLGPLVSLNVDGLFVRDNQRDFGLTKRAAGPSLVFRPRRVLSVTLGSSLELNDVQTFNAEDVEDAIRQNPSLASLLRVPDGESFVVAEHLRASWDRRDSPFDAKSGTLVTGGVEHVNAFPSDTSATGTQEFSSHFLRLTGRAAYYLRLSKRGASLATSVSGGYNLQLNPSDPTSGTYPDRLFFLGGVDSLRAFLADSVVPDDIARKLLDDAERTGEPPAIDAVGIRGGDFSINPRFELRLPYDDLVQLGLFLDMGNVWRDPAEIDVFAMRYAGGAGVRFSTPIGPLALDYGINLDRRPWEDFGAFHFSIGLF